MVQTSNILTYLNPNLILISLIKNLCGKQLVRHKDQDVISRSLKNL